MSWACGLNAPELISQCKLMMVILRDFDSFSSLLRKLDYTITSYTITSHLLLHVGIKQVIYSSQKKKKKKKNPGQGKIFRVKVDTGTH